MKLHETASLLHDQKNDPREEPEEIAKKPCHILLQPCARLLSFFHDSLLDNKSLDVSYLSTEGLKVNWLGYSISFEDIDRYRIEGYGLPLPGFRLQPPSLLPHHPPDRDR